MTQPARKASIARQKIVAPQEEHPTLVFLPEVTGLDFAVACQAWP